MFKTLIGEPAVLVAVATTVTVTVPPTPTLVKTQLIGLVTLLTHEPPLADASVRPGCTVSVTVTTSATEGPLFVATRVKVTRLPVVTVWLAGLLTIVISVTGVIVTVT